MLISLADLIAVSSLTIARGPSQRLDLGGVRLDFPKQGPKAEYSGSRKSRHSKVIMRFEGRIRPSLAGREGSTINKRMTHNHIPGWVSQGPASA